MYTPSRSDLIELGFTPQVEKQNNQVKWLLKVDPVSSSETSKLIVYRELYHTFGFGKTRFNIGNIEELKTLIKILNKKKARK